MTLTELAQSRLGQRQNTPDLIVEVLREAIGRGLLQPGQPLSQAELAHEFGVSTIPVREALRRLEADGLVALRYNRGAFVTELSAREVRELYEIRIPLETLALRLAMPHFTGKQLEKLEGILLELDTVVEGSRWAELDRGFHVALYEPCQRSRLLDLIGKLRANTELYHSTLTAVAHQYPECQADHREVLRQCERRDAKGATRALEHHLWQAGERVAQAIEQRTL
ncbi:GntR family transcriptional regulator [Deinococcus radiopugnans]|uniref:GntR family transcriptional regulator n=1 Tax=Deinococcus radiopugnans ATCC 19172 TaxID=585398 RepID=A0A5C4Y966_9DEIO|nr:GntR family transcriptional regulator [Deinococcus radiopugnans]MBB6015982.1 DNA-binding GntR family transcriptional regulator [Deinococcus radiopugnans ATCC 19172]TNM72330.1 GntR family transcriptional regulator [Deinococcus radiopugnans ATCC 19172]